MAPVSGQLHFQGMSTGKAGRSTEMHAVVTVFNGKQLSFIHILEENTKISDAQNSFQLGTHIQQIGTFSLE